MKTLWNDESGVILSAEIVLIGTILVLGMIAGLAELQSAVVLELSDLGDAFGSLNQSYSTSGYTAGTASGAHNKAVTNGTNYADVKDSCDTLSVTIVCAAVPEG